MFTFIIIVVCVACMWWEILGKYVHDTASSRLYEKPPIMYPFPDDNNAVGEVKISGFDMFSLCQCFVATCPVHNPMFNCLARPLRRVQWEDYYVISAIVMMKLNVNCLYVRLKHSWVWFLIIRWHAFHQVGWILGLRDLVKLHDHCTNIHRILIMYNGMNAYMVFWRCCRRLKE